MMKPEQITFNLIDSEEQALPAIALKDGHLGPRSALGIALTMIHLLVVNGEDETYESVLKDLKEMTDVMTVAELSAGSSVEEVEQKIKEMKGQKDSGERQPNGEKFSWQNH